MTDAETTHTIGKIFSKINDLDKKLTALEENVNFLLQNKESATSEFQEIRKLIQSLKDELTAGAFQQPYETCEGYKELTSKTNDLVNRVKIIEQKDTDIEKKQKWRMGIWASVIGGVLIAFIISFFTIFYTPETNNKDDKIDKLIELLIEDIRKER